MSGLQDTSPAAPQESCGVHVMHNGARYDPKQNPTPISRRERGTCESRGRMGVEHRTNEPSPKGQEKADTAATTPSNLQHVRANPRMPRGRGGQNAQAYSRKRNNNLLAPFTTPPAPAYKSTHRHAPHPNTPEPLRQTARNSSRRHATSPTRPPRTLPARGGRRQRG